MEIKRHLKNLVYREALIPPTLPVAAVPVHDHTRPRTGRIALTAALISGIGAVTADNMWLDDTGPNLSPQLTQIAGTVAAQETTIEGHSTALAGVNTTLEQQAASIATGAALVTAQAQEIRGLQILAGDQATAVAANGAAIATNTAEDTAHANADATRDAEADATNAAQATAIATLSVTETPTEVASSAITTPTETATVTPEPTETPSPTATTSPTEISPTITATPTATAEPTQTATKTATPVPTATEDQRIPELVAAATENAANDAAHMEKEEAAQDAQATRDAKQDNAIATALVEPQFTIVEETRVPSTATPEVTITPSLTATPTEVPPTATATPTTAPTKTSTPTITAEPTQSPTKTATAETAETPTLSSDVILIDEFELPKDGSYKTKPGTFTVVVEGDINVVKDGEKTQLFDEGENSEKTGVMYLTNTENVTIESPHGASVQVYQGDGLPPIADIATLMQGMFDKGCESGCDTVKLTLDTENGYYTFILSADDFANPEDLEDTLIKQFGAQINKAEGLTSPTATDTVTPEPTGTPTRTATPRPTRTATELPTRTATRVLPTRTPAPKPTKSDTAEPTATATPTIEAQKTVFSASEEASPVTATTEPTKIPEPTATPEPVLVKSELPAFLAGADVVTVEGPSIIASDAYINGEKLHDDDGTTGSLIIVVSGSVDITQAEWGGSIFAVDGEVRKKETLLEINELIKSNIKQGNLESLTIYVYADGSIVNTVTLTKDDKVRSSTIIPKE